MIFRLNKQKFNENNYVNILEYSIINDITIYTPLKWKKYRRISRWHKQFTILKKYSYLLTQMIDKSRFLKRQSSINVLM